MDGWCYAAAHYAAVGSFRTGAVSIQIDWAHRVRDVVRAGFQGETFTRFAKCQNGWGWLCLGRGDGYGQIGEIYEMTGIYMVVDFK